MMGSAVLRMDREEQIILTIQKVKQVSMTLQSRRANGPRGIPPELIKYG